MDDDVFDPATESAGVDELLLNNQCPRPHQLSRLLLGDRSIPKAFDRCPFSLMLQALERRQVPVPILRLLRSYFNGRTQVVKSGPFTSSQSSVLSGIGQGSLLGPKLFNMYIDGIFTLDFCSNPTVIGYADDILVIAPAPDTAAIRSLQRDLERIVGFYSSLGLSLNVKKSAVLLVAISPRADFDGVFFTLGGQPLPVVSQLKYLGVILSQSLSFVSQCDNLSSRSKQMLGALFSACKGLGPDRLRYLYIAKILPILCYSLPVACPSSKCLV